MRVICDAPGQTCNRLWSYVASISECIVKKKKLMIIFYDWTIEDFPNLLHCPWIYFPLWHKWYLERGNGWNNYKGLTWKVCHNKTWDKIFKFLGFRKGWWTRRDTQYIAQLPGRAAGRADPAHQPEPYRLSQAHCLHGLRLYPPGHEGDHGRGLFRGSLQSPLCH